MLITCAGLHGTGKTTIAKLIAEKLNLEHHSTGMVFRDMAREHGMDLIEFSSLAAKNHEIDKQLDQRMKNIGLKGNVILDGQLCWYFLKEDVDSKILLECDAVVRFGRILKRRKEDGDEKSTIDDVKRATLERERMEQARYKEIYGIDLSNREWVKKNHDIVIDTTGLSIDEVVSSIFSNFEGK